MTVISEKIKDFPLIILAGPTASGKSDLALNIGKRISSTIINFDSMQVYKDLKILSARPSLYDCRMVPHELYGFLESKTICSALFWRDIAIKKIKKTLNQGRTPILVGGTGFYIHALLNGIDRVPKSLPEYRKRAENLYKKSGKKVFYDIVKEVDHSIIDRIAKHDVQRLIRNYTVWLQTGKSLSEWYNKKKNAKNMFKKTLRIRLSPDRALLRNKISDRFYHMIKHGALEEVQYLKGTDLCLPIMKAHGVRELLEYITGKVSLADASERTINNIRQYAKRQDTWFNNKYISDYDIEDHRNSTTLHVDNILNLYNKL